MIILEDTKDSWNQNKVNWAVSSRPTDGGEGYYQLPVFRTNKLLPTAMGWSWPGSELKRYGQGRQMCIHMFIECKKYVYLVETACPEGASARSEIEVLAIY